MKAFLQKQNQPQPTLSSQAQRYDVHARSSFTSPLAHDFSRIPVQPRLAVSSPGDIYEQEADRLSEQLVNISGQTTRTGQERELLRTKRAGSNQLRPDSVPSIVDEVLDSPGESLSTETRANLEPRFGYDFSNIRVHTNERAAESARAVKARAYTVGDNIVFGAGQYAPFNSRGQKLLAHELVHVVQQDGGQQIIARTPDDDMGGRTIPASMPQKVLEAERKKKEKAIAQHEDEQRIVIDLMDKARKIQPDPKKGLNDPDNLLHNSVELFDSGRFRLTVLSPTHYLSDLHFDTRIRHAKVGGNYPVLEPPNPQQPGVGGLVFDSSALARFIPGASTSPSSGPATIQTLPAKVERAPGEAAPKETPAP